MSDLKTITYRPGAGEYAWTFGGAAPVMRLRTPCALERVHRGLLRGPGPVRRRSRVAAEHHRAQPADRPLLDRGGRARRHGGGALRVHDPRAGLGGVDDGAAVRRADRDAPDRAAHTSRSKSSCGSGSSTATRGCAGSPRRSRTSPPTCRWTPCTARSASRQPAARCAPRWCPTRSAGTWTRRRCARAPRATSASTCQGRCCRSATGTRARARARPAVSRSSAR